MPMRKASANASISSAVFSADRLTRSDVSTRAAGRRMACSTWLGFAFPQAEPLETNMFRSARKCSIVSARTRPAERFTIYGEASAGELISTASIAASRSSRWSRTARTEASAARSGIISRTAAPNAQICGTPSVPGRRFFSCPPPKLCGRIRTPLRTASAPTPFGACTLWPETVTRSSPSRFIESGSLQNACTASVWNSAGAFFRRMIPAISRSGSTAPVSLLTAMTLTSTVFASIAAANFSAGMLPSGSGST